MTQANLPDPALMDVLWAQAEPTWFLSKELFMRGMDGWDIKPVWCGGELAFITASNGPAFHFQSLGTKHPISRQMIKAFLQAIIDKHGYATTKTPKDDERQNRFNRAFGFEAVGEDDFDVHYKITRLR